MTRGFVEFASSAFGRRFRGERRKYESLRRNLIGSRMAMPVESWLSTALLASLLIALGSVPAAGLLAFLLHPGEAAEITLTAVFSASALTGSVLLSTRSKDGRRVKKARPMPKWFSPSHLVPVFFIISFALNICFLAYPRVLTIVRGALALAWGCVEAVLALIWKLLGVAASHPLCLVAPVGLFLVTFAVFLAYPRLRAWERRRKIDGLCSSAVSLMGSVAGVGLTPYESMKFLAQEPAYGEVSEEMRYLVRDVEIFGRDLLDALRRLSAETPSEKLREFLRGATTTITSGGDLRKYMMACSEEYSRANVRRLNEYLETLGLIAEIYVAAGVVLPTVLSIMFAVMAMMGEAPVTMLYGIIAVVPLATLAAVIAADAAEPKFLR